MITVNEIKSRVKEIFPKLHDGAHTHVWVNLDYNLEQKIGIGIYENRSGRTMIKHIPTSSTEKFVLKQIDDLINETYKEYWG